MSNNDVLIPPGAVGATAAVLRMRPAKIATVLSQRGGGTEALGNSGAPLANAGDEVLAFAEHPLNYRVVASHLARSTVTCSTGTMEGVILPIMERKSFVGFFWGISRELAMQLLVPDGSGRLFNTTARLNFGQET